MRAVWEKITESTDTARRYIIRKRLLYDYRGRFIQ